MPESLGSDAVLINGLGRYAGGDAVDLAVISVTQGKRYRFRLVSISCDPNFTFSIDNHNMTVIEVDGTESVPVTVDSLTIYSAQRFSVVVTMDQPVDNYCECILKTFHNIITQKLYNRDSARSLFWHDRLRQWHQLCYPPL